MDYLNNNARLADMHFVYGLAGGNAREARRIYQERFSNRVLPSAPTCASLHRRLAETGSFKRAADIIGRPRAVRTPELEEAVLNALEENPETSTRVIAEAVNSTQSTVWRIIHDQQFYPYHIQRVQALLPRDFPQRITMCQWFLRKLTGNPQYLRYVLFTDEANFSRNDITNFHNNHVWALENPHAVSERHYRCVVVPGGFGKRGIDGKIEACKWCRIHKKPFLGICLGFQTAVIEFGRNVLNLSDADSTELSKITNHPVVIEMPEHHNGQMGGTMRLGKRLTIFKGDENSIIRRLYGGMDSIYERYRHRYEVNPKYVKQYESKGMQFVGVDADNKRMEVFELDDHPYYIGVQYHPEYLSRPMNPSAPFVGLLLAAKDMLTAFLERGCIVLPPEQSDSDEDHLEFRISSNNYRDSSSACSSLSLN